MAPSCVGVLVPSRRNLDAARCCSLAFTEVSARRHRNTVNRGCIRAQARHLGGLAAAVYAKFSGLFAALIPGLRLPDRKAGEVDVVGIRAAGSVWPFRSSRPRKLDRTVLHPLNLSACNGLMNRIVLFAGVAVSPWRGCGLGSFTEVEFRRITAGTQPDSAMPSLPTKPFAAFIKMGARYFLAKFLVWTLPRIETSGLFSAKPSFGPESVFPSQNVEGALGPCGSVFCARLGGAVQV